MQHREPVVTASLNPTHAVSADGFELLDAVLHSTSHDLRSPLLSMTLSAELLQESLPPGAAVEGSTAAIALEAMRHGAKDLERMLQALTLVSRARRRQLEIATLPLRELLVGRRTAPDLTALPDLTVTVDVAVIEEALDSFAAEATAVIAVEPSAHDVSLLLPPPVDAPEFEGSPVAALLGSLQNYAGTPVERLAASEVLVARSGGRLLADTSGVRLSLPLAAGSGR